MTKREAAKQLRALVSQYRDDKLERRELLAFYNALPRQIRPVPARMLYDLKTKAQEERLKKLDTPRWLERTVEHFEEKRKAERIEELDREERRMRDWFERRLRGEDEGRVRPARRGRPILRKGQGF